MKQQFVLPGIGLLLSGVAIGVLIAQFKTEPVSPPADSAGRVVQSIQVGNPVYEMPMPVVDAYTINQVFKQVARLVTPTVVSVTAMSQRRRGWRDRDEEPELFDRFHPGPGRSSAGSGVIVSEDGYVVTNHHVVADADMVQVMLTDKRKFEAEVVGADPSTDLAVLRLDTEEAIPSIMLGDSDDVEVGEWVVAIGNPFHLNSTVTQGIVSALGRQVNIINDNLGIEDFIQTDAAINPGNSGGALVNLQGKLIGINTAIATERGSYEGYGFAVPVNLMTQVVNDLIAFGRVKRGFLGISMDAVTSDNREALGLDEIIGVVVQVVASDGPAALAGIREGDVIMAVNGITVNAPNQLQSRIALNRPGEVIDLDLIREGRPRSLQVTLVDKNDAVIRDFLNPGLAGPELQQDLEEQFFDPEIEPESPFQEMEEWGLVLRDLSAEDRRVFDLDHGAYVAYVRPDTPAYEDGLPRDVIITDIDGSPVYSLPQAFEAFEQAHAEENESVLVGVQRRDGPKAFYEINVPPSE